MACDVALAVAAVLGIIGGILGLVGKKGAFVLGIITAVLAVGCNIFGLLTRYHGYTYPLKDGTYSGTPANNRDNHLCACRARLPYRDRRSKERGRKAGRRSLKILIFRAL